MGREDAGRLPGSLPGKGLEFLLLRLESLVEGHPSSGAGRTFFRRGSLCQQDGRSGGHPFD